MRFFGVGIGVIVLIDEWERLMIWFGVGVVLSGLFGLISWIIGFM